MQNNNQIQVIYRGVANTWQFAVYCDASGVSVAQAIDASGLLNIFPWWRRDELSLGVYSVPVHLNDALCAGDRLEVYDPLTISPQRGRMLRVAAKRKRARQIKSAGR